MSLPFDLSAYVPMGGGEFNTYFGDILIDRAKPAGAAQRFVLIPEQKQLNGGGALHGGFLMTVADNVLGCIAHEALDAGVVAATVTLNCDFLSAGSLDLPLFARGHVTRKTRSLIFVTGELSQGERIVMTASGIWKVIGA